MVEIHAFRAIRPDDALADKIATLPYDVLSSAEARELAADNAQSFLHIDKSEVDLPADGDVHSDAVYAQADKNLQDFISKGWLKKDGQPQLYLYELTRGGRVQTGLVATTTVADYENGAIKRHEYTLPEKEEDRIRHFDATRSNTSPIFLTYRAEAAAEKLIENWKPTHNATVDFTSFYDVRHRVFVIDDEAVIQQLTEIFVSVPALYIADGHHRAASAVKVAKKWRDEGRATTESERFLSVIFPDTSLEILDYNRVVTAALPENFWEKVAEKFEIEKVANGKTEQVHDIRALTADGWVKLTPKNGILSADEVASLDVALLQTHILAPLLGIFDPKTSPDIEFVGGIRGIDALEAAVADGASIAFALYPPTLEALLSVADAGKIMPPKSTWFEPKLLSGLFLHDLEDD